MENYNKQIFKLTDKISDLIKNELDTTFSVKGDGSIYIKLNNKTYHLTIKEL